jgi:hypothetical protein
MEFLQANFTTNRHADPFDVLANTMGTLAGLLTVLLSKYKKT